MDQVTLHRFNAVYDKFSCEPGIAQEISDYFTFYTDGYQFNPRYQNKVWDGRIRLTSPLKPYLYSGLREKLGDFCRERDYELNIEFPHADYEFSEKEALDFIASIPNLPKELNGIPFKVKDHQLDAFIKAVRKGRITLLSPTSSGKSFVIYLLCRYYDRKTLIIVPRIGLVKQLRTDFEEYGMSLDEIHGIFGGQEKNVDQKFVVSTWQSLKDQDVEYFSQFEVVIGDEVHGFKAKELKGIMEKLRSCEIRIGMSGTLDGKEVNELVVMGLFGPIYVVTTTSELMAKGEVADLKIKCIVLTHPEAERKAHAKDKYPDEIDYIIGSASRNRFIKNLALSLPGNTLLLYQRVEKHGEPLYEMIKKEAEHPVLFVAGKVDYDDREEIRKFVNKQEKSTTVASLGTFSTGTNIPNINNLIFVNMTKAVVQVLQSIGRGLRLSSIKTKCTLYDIADDIRWKTHINYTMKHFMERIKIYVKEDFKYKIYNVELQ